MFGRRQRGETVADMLSLGPPVPGGAPETDAGSSALVPASVVPDSPGGPGAVAEPGAPVHGGGGRPVVDSADVQTPANGTRVPVPAAPAIEARPAAAHPPALRQGDAGIDAAVARLAPVVHNSFGPGEVARLSRANLAFRIINLVEPAVQRGDVTLSGEEMRTVVTVLINMALADARKGRDSAGGASDRSIIEAGKQRIQPLLLERIDVGKALALPVDDLTRQIGEVVGEILSEQKLQLNAAEQRDLVSALLDDLLGLGPLEVLLADESVTDILVNGPKQVYVERKGRLTLTDVTFRDNAHVLSICARIVSRVGRRVDEATPLCDARLTDGSRVNIIIPPLALDGPSISIRKFSRQKISLDIMERQKNLSAEMCTVLKIAARCRLNILISGGTGSGKTTLLNALSRMIDHGERIVTIEDAAELQLQQPHVVRLETRPPSLEGRGEISQRELVKNALRMRPDRIILGEIRAGEALDMLQAMNTGHDGSMCTIHANRPREALTRLENMVAMANVRLPNEAVRAQIAGAVNMIVQIARMRDGVRRITHISEIVGMEGEVVTMHDLFSFDYQGEDADGRLRGIFRCSGLRPHFTTQAQFFGLERTLLDAMDSAARVSP